MIRCEEKIVLSKDGKKIEATKDQVFRKYLGWTIEKVKFILQINDKKVCFEEEAKRTEFIRSLTQLDSKDSTSKEYCNKKGILLKTELTNYICADKVCDVNSDKVVAIKKDGLYGLVDFTGKEIVPPQYGDISSFSEGKAIVKRDNFYGVIDETGKEIVPPHYDKVFPFINGKAIVEKKYLYGFIDETGKEIVPLQYDFVTRFSEGRAIVKKDNFRGVIDKEGREIVPL